MSLIKNFPEVDFFFKNDSFSQNELLQFLKEIEEKYKENDLRKSVATLINLKMLQYETFSEKSFPSLNAVEKVEEFDLKPKKGSRLHPQLQKLKSYSLENIAKNLNWSFSKISRLLEQHGIFKSESEMLNKDEFEIVREMFSARLYGLQRINKSNKIKKRVSANKGGTANNSNDVYTKIRAIGLGKVIYIRKQ